MSNTILVDELTQLHPPSLDLADDLFKVLESNQTEFLPWLPWVGRMQSLDRVQQFMQESTAFNNSGQKYLYFIIHQKRCVGSVGLTRIFQQDQKANLGYWLDTSLQGNGIATKSCLQFINHIFLTKSVNRLEISVQESNQKSIEVAKRLGFCYEGIQKKAFFHNNLFYNVVLFGLTKKDWEKT